METQMNPSRDRIVPMLSEAQLRDRIHQLGAQIAADYADKDVVGRVVGGVEYRSVVAPV